MSNLHNEENVEKGELGETWFMDQYNGKNKRTVIDLNKYDKNHQGSDFLIALKDEEMEKLSVSKPSEENTYKGYLVDAKLRDLSKQNDISKLQFDECNFFGFVYPDEKVFRFLTAERFAFDDLGKPSRGLKQTKYSTIYRTTYNNECELDMEVVIKELIDRKIKPTEWSKPPTLVGYFQ